MRADLTGGSTSQRAGRALATPNRRLAQTSTNLPAVTADPLQPCAHLRLRPSALLRPSNIFSSYRLALDTTRPNRRAPPPSTPVTRKFWGHLPANATPLSPPNQHPKPQAPLRPGSQLPVHQSLGASTEVRHTLQKTRLSSTSLQVTRNACR